MDIGDRVGGLGGRLRGTRDAAGVQFAAAHNRLGVAGAQRCRRHAAQPDPHVAASAVVHRDHGGDGDDRQVHRPDPVFVVGPAAARRRRRQPDRRDQLAGLQHGFEVALDQLLDAEDALPGRPGHHDLGAQRDQCLRWVGPHLGVGQVAADRAQVADRHRGNVAGRLAQQRVALGDHWRGLDRPDGGHGADGQAYLGIEADAI